MFGSPGVLPRDAVFFVVRSGRSIVSIRNAIVLTGRRFPIPLIIGDPVFIRSGRGFFFCIVRNAVVLTGRRFLILLIIGDPVFIGSGRGFFFCTVRNAVVLRVLGGLLRSIGFVIFGGVVFVVSFVVRLCCAILLALI